MNKNIYEYFINLEEENLERENNIILLNRENRITNIEEGSSTIYTYPILDKTFYYKQALRLYIAAQSKVAADLYNKGGVLSPPIFLAAEKNSFSAGQLTQSITDIPVFAECIHPTDIVKYQKVKKKLKHSYNIWKKVSSPKIKEKLLEIMTPECYEQLVNMFLIDQLRTATDRHEKNYYLYKLEGSDKFNGVVVFDLDTIQILRPTIKCRNDFLCFLNQKYFAMGLPFYIDDGDTYNTRIDCIKRFISSGKASLSNINAIKNVLISDYPEDFLATTQKYSINEDRLVKEFYTSLSYLWDFNRSMLKNELGL